MSNVNELVSKVVTERNEENVRNTERRVRQLVDTILDCEANIKKSTNEIVRAKAELKELQMPEAVKVEV